jgi:hypothetical protein
LENHLYENNSLSQTFLGWWEGEMLGIELRTCTSYARAPPVSYNSSPLLFKNYYNSARKTGEIF